MGRLITHVLNTTTGTPDQNLAITLFKIVSNQRQPIKSIHTNHDGRCSAPLLEDDTLQTGVYELNFSMSGYYRTADMKLPGPTFLDVVTPCSGVADTNARYHMPLLVLPWSYSAYRGS